MNSSENTDQQTREGNRDAKPTMQDLWRMHPEIQNAAMIEASGTPYLRLVYIFCYAPRNLQAKA